MSQYKVLVPIDFSDCSIAALETAMTIARIRNAAVMLLHVDPGLIPFYDEELGILEPTRLFHHLQILAAERQASVGFPVEELTTYGQPIETIVQKANELNSDLIVMGTHGRTGVDRVLMGSVAEGVLRRAPCPVLCVKPGMTATTQEPSDREAQQAGEIS